MYWKSAEELSTKILTEKCESVVIEEYERIRYTQMREFKIRDNVNGFDISEQCSILKKVASLVDEYKWHNLKTMFTGSYFKSINSELQFCTNQTGFDSDRFQDCLNGELGDEEESHIEVAGINVFLCSAQPFHRVAAVPFLEYLVHNLKTQGGYEVDLNFHNFYSVPPSVAGHYLFPEWRVDYKFPTLWFRGSADFAICLRPVCCPTFGICESWGDFVDVLSLHNSDISCYMDGCVSPDLKTWYDRRVFPLAPGTKLITDSTLARVWKLLWECKHQGFLTRVIFNFLKAAHWVCKIASAGQVFQPLIRCTTVGKEICGEVEHQYHCSQSERVFTHLGQCRLQCAEELEEGTCESVMYTVCENVFNYIDSRRVGLDFNLTPPLVFKWMLYERESRCPHPGDQEGKWEIDIHKFTVESGTVWHENFGDCLTEFYSQANCVNGDRGRKVHFEKGDLMICVQESEVTDTVQTTK
jgi:hypothetical protein